jgi:hypothetical protein
MYTLITIFYISLIGIIVMILWKWHEVETGRPSLVSRLGHGSDHIFHAFFSGIRQGISYINRHTFIALAQWMAFRALVPVRKVYVEIKHKALTNPHGKKVIDAVRGRGEITSHGASFYLRKIAKEETVNGKL